LRGTEIGHKGFKLKRFEEAFTSENWIVRIFKVLPRESRESVIIHKSKLLQAFPENVDTLKEESKAFVNHKYGVKVAPYKRRG